MKKIAYICSLMLLCMNGWAQLNGDRNWRPVLIDDFDTLNRQFNSSFHEPLDKWISYAQCVWPSGVTKKSTHGIYQWDRCEFVPDSSIIKLKSEYIQSTPIQCGSYDIPVDFNYSCDNTHEQLFYETGMIENHYDTSFLYGYFEIRCKLPIHRGAFPAFWLWGSKDSTQCLNPYYEEIDIFEFSWAFEDPDCTWQNQNPHGVGNPFCFTTGVYYNNTSSECGYETSYGRNYPMINDSVSNWHTYACEWLPEHIIFYCDGQVVNECNNPDSIPHHPLCLKANYAIDGYALSGYEDTGTPEWAGSDSMVIDFINVYQLQYECDEDIEIASQRDLDGFAYTVKKSIDISATQGLVQVYPNDAVTLRVTDSFSVTGLFQVDSGGELCVITQLCPENAIENKQ